MLKKDITINQLFHLLKMHYQDSIEDWWPHETKHEIIIGAFLVQNTTWHNVELSLNKIRKQYGFVPDVFRSISKEELIDLIYSSGFHQNKAQSIMEFFQWTQLFDDNYEHIKAHFGSSLRRELLKKTGIGPETADVLMIYVFNEPVFIADNYARRLFTKLEAPIPINYSTVKKFAEENGQLTIEEWSAFHGWIIQFAQAYLKPKQAWENNLLVSYRLIANK